MRFRTEIEQPRGSFSISHDSTVVMLGSCFTDNIGERLRRDGFNVCSNPLGPLYNPLSLADCVRKLIDGYRYTTDDLYSDGQGTKHCLDYASRYSCADAEALLARVNNDFDSLKNAFDEADALIVTFGSAHGYYMADDSRRLPVGNCHKLDDRLFNQQMIDTETITEAWQPLLRDLVAKKKNVILTVSPIRHLTYGLAGNSLTKARLLLACERLRQYADYFPAFEIMIDDLRDYRFYDADMKHPSAVAVDYIYELFGKTYFSDATAAKALACRRIAKAALHRPIRQD